MVLRSNFYRGNIERVIEGLTIFLNKRVANKTSHVSRDMTVLFLKATKVGYPRGEYVHGVLCSVIFVFFVRFARVLLLVFPYKPNY